jgi:hypothetical protein
MVIAFRIWADRVSVSVKEGEAMAERLEDLIEIARKYREQNGFTAEERERQVRSFAYGNTHLENEQITKRDIDTAMDSLRSEREQPICS